MGATLHERELQDSYWRDRARGMNPEEVEHCLGLFYSEPGQTWVVHFLTQSNAAWDIYDAYALHALLSWWMDGFVAFAHVPVGARPTWDRLVEENNARLAGLPHGFRATFAPTGGFGYCDDGTFEWTEPLRLAQRVGDGVGELVVEPGSLPLEVGRTKSSRTLLHILCDCGVARWACCAARRKEDEARSWRASAERKRATADHARKLMATSRGAHR